MYFINFKLVFSISMVEQPPSHDLKNRSKILPNGVKLRIPGNRSRKSDAPRNSRAFALQLKQLSEEHSSSVFSEKMSPSSASSRGNRSFSTIVAPTPLKSIPVQNLTKNTQNLLGSQTPNVGNRPTASAEKLYNTISGATGRHLSASSTFFHDEYEESSNIRMNRKQDFTESLTSYDGSTWSLLLVEFIL